MVSAASALTSLMAINTKHLVQVNVDALSSAMEKILIAMQAMVEEMNEIRNDQKNLEVENGELKAMIEKRGLEAQMMVKTIRTLEDRLGASTSDKAITNLKEHIKSLDAKLQTKADLSEFERFAVRMETQRQVTEDSNKIGRKDLDELKDFVTSEAERLTQNIAKMGDSRAPKSVVADQEQKIDALRTNLESAILTQRSFSDGTTAKLAELEDALNSKASFIDMNDKIGRVECTDILRELSSKISSDFGKCEKSVHEMREDIDCVLGLMLQNNELAAGMTKCLSCAKMLPPKEMSVRSIDLPGVDRNIYRGETSALNSAGEEAPMFNQNSRPLQPAQGGTVLERLMVSPSPVPYGGRNKSPDRSESSMSRNETALGNYSPHWPLSSSKIKAGGGAAESPVVTGPRVRPRPKSATPIKQ